MSQENSQTATFGCGCFWCSEAVFEMQEGVHSVTSGYSNGTVPSPTYEQVCTGKTGHAEVIKVEFDADVVSFEDLVRLFFRSHDPTTLNRQGADVGTQYRSGIYFHNDEQKETAESVKAELDTAGVHATPIVTEIVPAETFYPAEDYHQDFFRLNGHHPYCQAVIQPKIEKLKQ